MSYPVVEEGLPLKVRVGIEDRRIVKVEGILGEIFMIGIEFFL